MTAPDTTPPKPTCAPPEGTASGTWHWLQRRDGSQFCCEWLGDVGTADGIFLAMNGYRYLAPVRPYEPASPVWEVLEAMVDRATKASDELEFQGRYREPEFLPHDEHVVRACAKGVVAIEELLATLSRAQPSDAERTGAEAALRAALEDMLAGWHYIRLHYGDLAGVGWDRTEMAANNALALPPSAEPAGWRDIASAPKNDTEVDLWANDRRYTDSHYHCGEWLRWNFSSVDDEPAWVAVVDPTHWMPLPTPPASGAAR